MRTPNSGLVDAILVQRDYDLVKLYLSKGADPNYNFKTKTGIMTPLYIAASNNDTRICQLLLEYKANPNWQNSYDKNRVAIHFAIKHNNSALVKDLIKYGTKLDIFNIYHYPLDPGFFSNANISTILIGAYIAKFYKTLPTDMLVEGYSKLAKLKDKDDLKWEDIEDSVSASSEFHKDLLNLNNGLIPIDSRITISSIIESGINKYNYILKPEIITYALDFISKPLPWVIHFLPNCIGEADANLHLRKLFKCIDNLRLVCRDFYSGKICFSVVNDVSYKKSKQIICLPNEISAYIISVYLNVDYKINLVNIGVLSVTIEEKVKMALETIKDTYTRQIA